MLAKPDPQWCAGWNFGPVSGTELPVEKLADAFVKSWGKGSWVDQSSPDQPHEASILRLSIEKAGWDLGWHPRWSCAEMVEKSARWYRSVLCEKTDARAACEADIAAYERMENVQACQRQNS